MGETQPTRQELENLRKMRVGDGKSESLRVHIENCNGATVAPLLP
jgi:hypothetical protein